VLLLVKIAYWPLPPLLLPLCAMQLGKVRSYIAVKEICASVWPLQSVYQDCVTRFLLAQPSPCTQALQRKFFLPGKSPKRFIVV
jgi:hypothetical protein